MLLVSNYMKLKVKDKQEIDLSAFLLVQCSVWKKSNIKNSPNFAKNIHIVSSAVQIEEFVHKSQNPK